MRSQGLRSTVAALFVVFAGACGGGSGGGAGDYNAPTGPSGGGSGVQSGATIAIGANGAVTAQVTINVGQGVTFVNSHNRPHNISSDPHNVHTDCPALNSIGVIVAGQTKNSTAFTTARTCGYHDHDDPDNAAMKATVVVR